MESHKKIRLKRLRVKKRAKNLQKFTPEKIHKALVKTGVERRTAEQITRNVVNGILQKSKTSVVTYKKMAEGVIKELKKKDKKTAKTFEHNMKKKAKSL